LGWEKKVVRECSRGVAWTQNYLILRRMNPENGLNVKKEIWGLSRIKKKKGGAGLSRRLERQPTSIPIGTKAQM